MSQLLHYTFLNVLITTYVSHVLSMGSGPLYLFWLIGNLAKCSICSLKELLMLASLAMYCLMYSIPGHIGDATDFICDTCIDRHPSYIHIKILCIFGIHVQFDIDICV